MNEAWFARTYLFLSGQIKLHNVKIMLTLFLKTISHQKTIRYYIFVDDEWYTVNSSQQTIEQPDVIQEIILPYVSNWMTRGDKNQQDSLSSLQKGT